jgi:hypothetical protein
MSKELKKLKLDDTMLLLNFLIANEKKDYSEFTEAVNRMFLGNKWPKTKNFRSVQTILDNLNKTVPGMYGWNPDEEKKWVHPLDRKESE